MSRTALEASTMNAESAVAAESDMDLMRAVIQRRDRRAFACLAERHQRAAFNLARHLTRTAPAAEDVVQEALLRAWAAAGTFRREGSVRGWLLRIVAREAFRANRRQRAEQQRIERRQVLEPRAQEEGPAAMGPEDTEEVMALRTSLGALSEPQRALLALYYGAELSQEEIGRHLELPQRTISRRLQEALDALRGRLAQAGMAAAPLLGAEHLGAALLNAEAPPAGMFERFGAKLAHTGAEASRRVAAVKAGLPWAWLAAGALALAVVAAVVWPKPPGPSTPPATQAAPVEAAPPMPQAATDQKKEDPPPAPPASWHWTFPGRLPAAFEPLDPEAVSFETRRGEQGLALPNKPADFVIRQALPEGPLVLRIRFRGRGAGDDHIGFALSDGTQACASRAFVVNKMPPLPARGVTSVWYLVDDFAIGTEGAKLSSVAEMMRQPGDDYIVFGGRNLVILEFSIQALRRDEIPAAYRDPRSRFGDKQALSAVERQPLRRRGGQAKTSDQ